MSSPQHQGSHTQSQSSYEDSQNMERMGPYTNQVINLPQIQGVNTKAAMRTDSKGEHRASVQFTPRECGCAHPYTLDFWKIRQNNR